MKQNMFKSSRTQNSARPKGARNKTLRAEQERKHAEAVVRQAEHSGLTPKQKLAKLDARLGVGVGAVRERARLLTQVAESQKQVSKAPAEAVSGAEKQKTASGKKTRSPKANKQK